MSQKISLISINSRYVHASLSVWYLHSAIREICDVRVVESTIKQDAETIAQDILSNSPDIVAFSCYIWNIALVKSIFKRIKSISPNTTILLGGPEVSYNAQEIFDTHTEVDFIISGEGERPLYEFMLSATHNNDFSTINGLCTRQKISTAHTSSQDPPSPFSPEYFAVLNGRISYIESSRGCPYSCSYCLSGATGNVKFFDLDRVFREIDLLRHSGSRTIKFVDRTFNCNPSRALAIINHIKSTPNPKDGICFHFEVAADIMTKELIDALCDSPRGLFQIEVGVQSFNEKTLDAVRRKTDLHKVFANMERIIKSANIHVHMDLIAGLPYEDFASFADGFDKLFSLAPHMLQLGFLKVLHGSTIGYTDGYSKNPPYEVTHTPWISKEELDILRAVEDATDRLYNSGRFKMLLLHALKVRPGAFELLRDFGTKNRVSHGERLESYTQKVLSYFSEILGFDKAADLMREQWIISNSSSLPSCLKTPYSPEIAQNIRNVKEARREGVKRAATYLKCTNEIIYADYDSKDIITGEYTAHKISQK